jgi:hypothetical protein
MKTIVSAPPSGSAYPPTTPITVADMRHRWGKFSDAELGLIEHRSQLLQQIQGQIRPEQRKRRARDRVVGPRSRILVKQ